VDKGRGKKGPRHSPGFGKPKRANAPWVPGTQKDFPKRVGKIWGNFGGKRVFEILTLMGEPKFSPKKGEGKPMNKIETPGVGMRELKIIFFQKLKEPQGKFFQENRPFSPKKGPDLITPSQDALLTGELTRGTPKFRKWFLCVETR